MLLIMTHMISVFSSSVTGMLNACPRENALDRALALNCKARLESTVGPEAYSTIWVVYHLKQPASCRCFHFKTQRLFIVVAPSEDPSYPPGADLALSDNGNCDRGIFS